MRNKTLSSQNDGLSGAQVWLISSYLHSALKTEEAVEMLRVIIADVKLHEFHFLTKPGLQTSVTKQTIEGVSTSLHSPERNINFKAKLGAFKCK